MYVIKDNVIKLSVRGLVEFICRSGDIDNRTGGFSDVRLMQEGTRMHKKYKKHGRILQGGSSVKN